MGIFPGFNNLKCRRSTNGDVSWSSENWEMICIISEKNLEEPLCGLPSFSFLLPQNWHCPRWRLFHWPGTGKWQEQSHSRALVDTSPELGMKPRLHKPPRFKGCAVATAWLSLGWRIPLLKVDLWKSSYLSICLCHHYSLILCRLKPLAVLTSAWKPPSGWNSLKSDDSRVLGMFVIRCLSVGFFRSQGISGF